MICFDNNLFKREISYFAICFKNGYPSWFFDHFLTKSDDRYKLGMQKLKQIFPIQLMSPIYGKSFCQFAYCFGIKNFRDFKPALAALAN